MLRSGFVALLIEELLLEAGELLLIQCEHPVSSVMHPLSSNPDPSISYLCAKTALEHPRPGQAIIIGVSVRGY